MKNTFYIAVACAVVGCIVIAVIATRNPNIRVAEPIVREPAVQSPTPATQPAIASEPSPRVSTVAEATTSPSNAPSPSPLIAANSSPDRKVKPKAPAVVDLPAPDPDKPIARQALTLVGADPVAEQIWISSINDPNVSAHDRQDLIEDLNEEGFDDPKNLTTDDLPLIESRIALIESLAPSSMDDVNAAAFAEAYKDLINMHGRVVGQ